jgi:hypothetical protein
MEQTPTIAAETKGPNVSVTGTSSKLLFWIIVGIPVSLLLLAFPAINSPFFKRHGDPATVSAQTGLFEITNRKCDILMYGDSTAEVGLDPVIIEQVTHLSACNIATGGPTLTVLGLDPFNQYLARNPRPRYLVIQFVSGYLHRITPGHADLDHFDGVIESIRFHGWIKTLPVMLRFPDYFIGLLNYTYKSGVTEIAMQLLGKRPHRNSLRPDSYFVFQRPALTDCPIYNGSMVLPDRAWITYLRQHYSSYAEHILVDVSPTSPCNHLYPAWKAAIAGTTDNELELYPNSLFVDGTYHTSREGAIRRSNELAQQILQAEAKFSQQSADRTSVQSPVVLHDAPGAGKM